MKKTFYGLLAMFMLLMSGCNNQGGDIMQLVAERDSLKNQNEVQNEKLTAITGTITAINAALDSIALQEGMIFASDSREAPLTRLDALKNLQRFEGVLNKQKEKIAALEAQLAEQKEDKGLKGLVEHLQNQLREKDAQIAMLKSELSKKDVNISQLRREVASQRSLISEQTEAIAQLDKKNRIQTTALTKQDEVINTCYVMIGTKSDLKRRGIIKGKKLLADGALDKSKFAKVDIRKFKEISFEAKRPRILTNTPPSAYTLATKGKHSYTLYITNVTAFWSISNFLIIQTD